MVVSEKLQAAYAARQARADAAGKPFNPSIEQRALYDWIETGTGNALVRACAGSGKTTTLVEGLRYMDGNIFFGCFGKSASLDIQAKADSAGVTRPGIKISTIHSAGYGEFVRLFPKVVVEPDKTYKLIDNYANGHFDKWSIIKSKSFLLKMVSYAKQYLIGCPNYSAIPKKAYWLELCEHFSAEDDLPDGVEKEDAIDWCIDLLNESNERAYAMIDFDDMIYIPILNNLKFFPNDWFLGDEWQDANPARREIAYRMLKSGGRGIFVGDDRQAIFGFTGASHDSLDITKELFNCHELSLSTTYRCPKAVVSYVKTLDPAYMIEAPETAEDGIVRTVPIPEATDTTPWFLTDKPDEDAAVLCRYTRPLLQTAYAMIKEGIACKVEGRDIGKNLITLARRWRMAKTLDQLEAKLKVYLARELLKAREAESTRREQDVEDRVGSVMVFIERCRTLKKHTVDELVAEIESMFADGVTRMITLATGHRAKGREWPNIFWLQHVDRRQFKKEWESLSERNVRIVIGTRAMNQLVLVPERVYQEKKK